jgi:hypothetical protein
MFVRLYVPGVASLVTAALTVPFGDVVTDRCAIVWTSAKPPSADCRLDSALWTLPRAEICVWIGCSCDCSRSGRRLIGGARLLDQRGNLGGAE